MLHRALVALLLGLFAVVLPRPGVAGTPSGEPLRERIDGLVEAAHEGPFAVPADDAEFLRRVYLDLAGVIPPADVARRFLADPAAGKREALVRRLVAGPLHARRMLDFLDEMLMERRPEKHVKSAEWRAYLLGRLREGVRFHDLARELLAADGTDERVRAASRFYLDREGELNAITRDIGRIFFGMDLQCAQCHDHPLIDGYKQADYYGIYAFLTRTSLFTDKKKKVLLAEKADGEATFTSVFDPEKTTHDAAPRLPGGEPLEEPELEKGKEYEVAPAKDVRSVPRFSRRTALAERAASGDNRAFNRNIANRLWAMMMGRGLVEPVDLIHPDNPPSHPELLDLLADELAAMDFDTGAFLAEIALTRTYQRSSTPPPIEIAAASDVLRDAAGDAVIHGAGGESGGTLDAAVEGDAGAPDDETRLGELERRLAVAPLKPLGPEQLAWSFMEALGIAGTQRAAASKERAAKSNDTVSLLREDETRRRAEDAAAIEEAVDGKVAGHVAPFVKLFASLPGQPREFQASVQQALFFSNDGRIRGWLKPGGGTLAARLLAIEDPAALADELYLSVLTRLPDEGEARAVADYLAELESDRGAAVEGMIWALLTSVEFRFNH